MVSRYTVQIVAGEPKVRCMTHSGSGGGYHPFKAYWDQHIAEKPVYIENDRQRERLMRQGGLAVRPREHVDDLNHRRWTKGLPPVKK